MVGKENRVTAKMKLVVPTMLSVHCICHRTDMDRYQQKYRVCQYIEENFDNSPKRSAAQGVSMIQVMYELLSTQIHSNKLYVSGL